MTIELEMSPEVAEALRHGKPVVALESTIISHGLPWPANLDLARDLENIIRENGAVPATVGVFNGRITVGLNDEQITEFARAGDPKQDVKVTKISRRDLATVVALKQHGATTVATTMIIAAMAGIRVFATGGIGGVHRGAETSMDISADLRELAATPVAVVCSGAKSILDLPKTLEYLETHGVPVLGYGVEEFPAFHSRESGLYVDQKLTGAEEVAAILQVREELGLIGGEIIANPIPEEAAIEKAVIDGWIEDALKAADADGVIGKKVTPYLLSKLAELSGGKSIDANLALVKNNARVAAHIAREFAKG
ncbi:pseudouridine-5'-phosphate glycosidase [Aestuariispira insulae]|uniref:Pseudouridine-5'-phosphate glycosidase n=1 Tax=Aestuariispira insulae TaxID=1461337 RepID=A0A3D9HHS9_9PROT|nr:pseudouridine-5'-phosphate glycosidase [Aestuariispira insulae]RED49092.1 pseudouridine-5'-phosphate glycosidase [Aestuariispira insulae]